MTIELFNAAKTAVAGAACVAVGLVDLWHFHSLGTNTDLLLAGVGLAALGIKVSLVSGTQVAERLLAATPQPIINVLPASGAATEPVVTKEPPVPVTEPVKAVKGRPGAARAVEEPFNSTTAS